MVFNSPFKYFEDNKLLNCNQSRFRPRDSCVHQLLQITHVIQKPFDAKSSLEVMGVFWTYLNPLIEFLEIEFLEICGRCYNLVHSFWNNRHRRVVLNGQSSKWSLAEAGVPQGSILGPLLFFLYINDLPQGLYCNAKLFADDTALFSTITKSCNIIIKS